MDIIKSINTNQHQILSEIKQLHNNGNDFECDITYSCGNFYNNNKYPINPPKYKFDVFPQLDDVVKIEPLGEIPLEDNSISSIVIDLPFVISTGPSLKTDNPKNNIIARRFASYYPASELYKSYHHWINEAYRVLKPNGICVFKCQDTVSGGIEHNVSVYSCMCAMDCGFIVDDTFILEASQRLISGKVKKQQHARKYHSYFYVFKKIKSKKYDKFNYINLINNLNK